MFFFEFFLHNPVGSTWSKNLQVGMDSITIFHPKSNKGIATILARSYYLVAMHVLLSSILVTSNALSY